MARDYDAPWFSKTTWIFEHLQDLSLEADELIVLLVLAYLIDQKIPVSYETLVGKCHLDDQRVDAAIDTLSIKGYLRIDMQKGTLSFLLDGLFEQAPRRGTPLNQPVLQAFEEEFGRTFSPTEMERISQMAQIYGETALMYALDEAAVYETRNLNYIENILISWKNKGLNDQDLERGKR